jgi:hypothetical protein
MEFVVETFPLVFGVLLGLSCDRLGGVRQRWPLATGGSMALGAFATLASGEWRDNLACFAFDMALVGAACAGTAWLLMRLRARRGSAR